MTALQTEEDVMEAAAQKETGPALELIEQNSESDSADGHYRSSLFLVEAGQSVAKVLDPGRLRLGQGVEISPDGQLVLAQRGGLVHTDNERIWIDAALTVPGNVDFATGNINCVSDVLVKGSVLDLFSVRSGGSIRVNRAIEAAEIVAAGDLVVCGGIVAKEKGHCRAGGKIEARFATNASLQATGDVLIHGEVANTRIACGGRAMIQRGAILGGRVIANGGIQCNSLGCPSGSPTIVEVGTDDLLCHDLTSLLSAVEVQRQRAQKVRRTVEPLLRNAKTLTPQQKEKATELLFEADEAEHQATETLSRHKDRLARAKQRSKLEIVVQTVLQAGVIIRFPGLEARVESSVNGAMRIQLHIDENGRRMVIARPNGRLVAYLVARAVSDPMAAVEDRIRALAPPCPGQKPTQSAR